MGFGAIAASVHFSILQGKTDVYAAEGLLVVLVCGLGALSRDLPVRPARKTFMKEFMVALRLERSTGDR
jgi:hypothetical protein